MDEQNLKLEYFGSFNNKNNRLIFFQKGVCMFFLNFGISVWLLSVKLELYFRNVISMITVTFRE